MGSANAADRRDFDIAASQSAQDYFLAVANRLESLLDQRDADVAAAMADYRADGVSDEFAIVEQRWRRAGTQTRSIINTLKESLASNDESASTALRQASTAVANIG